MRLFIYSPLLLLLHFSFFVIVVGLFAPQIGMRPFLFSITASYSFFLFVIVFCWLLFLYYYYSSSSFFLILRLSLLLYNARVFFCLIILFSADFAYFVSLFRAYHTLRYPAHPLIISKSPSLNLLVSCLSMYIFAERSCCGIRILYSYICVPLIYSIYPFK